MNIVGERVHCLDPESGDVDSWETACVARYNTVYMNAALDQLRANGHPVLDQDVIRLSPFVRRHLGVHGDYSFLLPEFAGTLRELRDPDSDDGEQED